MPGFCFRSDHRRQLEEISEKNHLHVSERQRVFTVNAKKMIDCLEYVGSYHGDLVDDDNIDVLVDPPQSPFFDIRAGE